MTDYTDFVTTKLRAVPPEGFVMVPVELAQRVQESLGEFLMDHGWSQRDMDTSDEFGAVLLAADPKAEPVPAGEREELREGASYESMNLAAMVLSDCGHSSNYIPLLERVAGRIDRHVERLHKFDAARLEIESLHARVQELEREAHSLRKDAERFRFANESEEDFAICYWDENMGNGGEWMCYSDKGDAIEVLDAAIRASGAQGDA